MALQVGRVSGGMLVLLMSLLIGCKGKAGVGQEASDSPEGKHLRKVADLCREYGNTQKKTLANLDQVKEWAIKEGKAAEDDFLSTRDKQPYGLTAGGAGMLLVYEQAGAGGKRFVYNMGRVLERPNAEVEGMINGFKGMRIGRGK